MLNRELCVMSCLQAITGWDEPQVNIIFENCSLSTYYFYISHIFYFLLFYIQIIEILYKIKKIYIFLKFQLFLFYFLKSNKVFNSNYIPIIHKFFISFSEQI